MITLVEGTIGSGKTYFVVYELINKYFKWDDEKVKFVRRDDLQSFEIFTNIDGFHACCDLKQAIENFGGLESFFNIEFQKKITNEKRHIYVIDEAQIFFPRKFYNTSVFNFFQYSRHMGIDVYLITQDVQSLSRELQTLNEYHIKVSKRSFSFMGEFRYMYMSGYDVLKRKVLKADKRVFSQYRSSLSGVDSHSVNRFANKFYFYIIGLVFLIIAGGFGFVYMLSGGRYFEKGKNNTVASVDKISSSKSVITRSVRVVGAGDGYVYLVDDKGKYQGKKKLKK